MKKSVILHLAPACRLKRKTPEPTYEYRKVPHSLNARLHWIVRDQWNSAWHRAVFDAIERHGKVPRLLDKAVLVVTYHCIRRLDRDNAYTAAKPIVDALKVWISKRKQIPGAGVILDDDDDHLDLIIKQERVHHVAEEHVSLEITKA